MNKDKYVFAQLVSFMDNFKFLRIVKKYEGDKYVKSFSCWNQLLTMMFGQLTNRESLRDLIVATEAHSRKLYHLGMGKSVTRSNLSKANEQRDYRIFEEFAYFMIDEARRKRQTEIFKLGGSVYAFDSTTIDLCLAVFDWAKFRSKKGGIKVHTLYDIEAQVPAFLHITTASVHDSKAMPQIPLEENAYYIFDRGYNDFAQLYRIHTIGACFVIRAKNNVKYRILSWKRKMPSGVLSDSIIEFTVYKSSKVYPEKLRRVVYRDEETGVIYTYLTNDLESSALVIANLYKNRWSVELFFKWIKQHLKIKKFWGTSENAVRIQIYCAITTYCLVAIMQHDMKLKRSVYEVLQILGISLTDKTPLCDLFDKKNINDVNVLYGSSEPNLFNYLTD
jgi:hypothetical protein